MWMQSWKVLTRCIQLGDLSLVGLLKMQMMSIEANLLPSFALSAVRHRGGSNGRFGVSF